MSIHRPQIDGNAALKADIERLETRPRKGARTVPEKPTMEMLTAGSLAGDVSVETAWNIWQAMLKTAP